MQPTGEHLSELDVWGDVQISGNSVSPPAIGQTYRSRVTDMSEPTFDCRGMSRTSHGDSVNLSITMCFEMFTEY